MNANNPLWDFLYKVREELKAQGLWNEQEDTVVKLPGEVMDELLEKHATEKELEKFMEIQLKFENYEGAQALHKIMVKRGYRKEEDSSTED